MARRRLRPYLRDRLARDLQKYLIDGEDVVVSVRQHWMSLIAPIAAAIGSFVLAAWMDVKAPATQVGHSASQAFWFLFLVGFGWFAWRWFNWRRDWFVATDKRFLLFYGFIHRRVAMMPLAKVTDLTFHRSLLARLLGYGDFRLESAGQNQALSRIDFIPKADEHYRAICDVLFGDDGPDEAEDDFDDDDGEDWDDPTPSGQGPSPRYAARSAPGVASPAHSPVAEPFPSGPFADDGRWADGIPESDDPIRDSGSVYRSEDLVRADRLADTGEIPVVVARHDTKTWRRRPPRRGTGVRRPY